MASDRSPGTGRKVLLAPLRLLVGWSPNPNWLSAFGIVALVLLRVTIGWHFYSEGIDKVRGDGFDSSRFLSAARGPFAPYFRGMIWDWDGQIRLNAEATRKQWESYADRAKGYFEFNDAQRQRADALVDRHLEQLKWVLENNEQEIEEYELGSERVENLRLDPTRDDVSSLRAQREQIQREWRQKLAPVLVQIDTVWTNLESQMNGLATDQQRERSGRLKLGRPRNRVVDTTVVDEIIPWFDLAVGVCLLLGLFTPVAALAAAAFLGSVFVSQFPPETGPGSTYYPLVEAMGLFVLAATGAGRFAGLDFFLHAIALKLWPTESGE